MPRIRAENLYAHKVLNRSAILQAAEKLFSTEGFLTSNMTDVADMAGVGRSTIYEYFPSKDDLLLGVAESRILPLMRAVEELETSEGPVQDICNLCRMTIDFMAENLELTRVITWESRYLSKEYQERLWQTVAPLTKKFVSLIERGMPGEDASVLARLVTFALRDAGDIMQHAEEDGFEFETVKQTSLAFIRRGLGLPPIPASS
ncbi:MAG: TetR/AcrR family transcriptional regulator [Acidimicrobiia bacterium]|nr:TetR/AcrR family transcriptional regulator [Acidimicrobiia bacterium]NNC43050.1 TetR/AcrR family transcriptional regulator [Acidimicrobiia bacterium]